MNLTQKIDKSRAGVYWLNAISGDVGFDQRHTLSKTRRKTGFILTCGHPAREESTASQALRAVNWSEQILGFCLMKLYHGRF